MALSRPANSRRHRRRLRVAGDARPVFHIPQVRLPPAEQQRVGRAHALGVVVIEVLVVGIVFVEILEQGPKIPILSFVIAVKREEVTDDQFAHWTRLFWAPPQPRTIRGSSVAVRLEIRLNPTHPANNAGLESGRQSQVCYSSKSIS